MTRNLTSTELTRLHREWRRRTTGRLALVLDGVQGPFNVGAIVRTAAAERADHIWFAAGATTPANSKVGKTALGTDRYVTWTEVPTATEAITEARTAGYTIVGVELAEGASALHELDLNVDACLVIGHEDRGLAKDTLAACDLLGLVPQLGKVGSLNVATATAIATYEVRRQHWTGH
ncbi:MAG: TrmH family RNA methyltransferase [Acidimicrobiales bacterium]